MTKIADSLVLDHLHSYMYPENKDERFTSRFCQLHIDMQNAALNEYYLLKFLPASFILRVYENCIKNNDSLLEQ